MGRTQKSFFEASKIPRIGILKFFSGLVSWKGNKI